MAATFGPLRAPQPWLSRRNALIVFTLLASVATCIAYVWNDMFFVMEVRVKGSLNSRPLVLQPLAPLVQSSRTCNRIVLPAHLSNDTQGPYNPAAVRDPSTGDWITIFRIEEVRTCNPSFQ